MDALVTYLGGLRGLTQRSILDEANDRSSGKKPPGLISRQGSYQAAATEAGW